MNKMLVVVFAGEREAYAGVRALKQLDAEGSLSLYAVGVVAKDADGKVGVRDLADPGPVGTGVGLAVGALIGMLGGPAGMAVGAVAGTLAGAARDSWVAGVGFDFVDAAAASLLPGRAALVAEVEEEWVIPLDSAMEAAGGEVFRRARSDMEEARLNREISGFKAELAELSAEYRKAGAEAQDRLRVKLDLARANLAAAAQRARRHVEEMEHEARARLAATEVQLKRARGELRDRIRDRLERVRNLYAERGARLGKAAARARKALGD